MLDKKFYILVEFDKYLQKPVAVSLPFTSKKMKFTGDEGNGGGEGLEIDLDYENDRYVITSKKQSKKFFLYRTVLKFLSF